MTDRYDGPATLHTNDDRTYPVTVHLSTSVDAYEIRTWQGAATTHDLAALGAARQGGKMVMPDGREGEVHVVSTTLEVVPASVLIRLHGAGPEPYGEPQA